LSIIYQILNGLICGAMACLDAEKISEGKKVNHFLNGFIHLAVALVAVYIFDWKIGLAILFQSRVIFDVSLNLFRGLGIDYVSLNPASLVDRFEKKIFGTDGITPKIVYLFISIILNVC
jgi:hypothetical protein